MLIVSAETVSVSSVFTSYSLVALNPLPPLGTAAVAISEFSLDEPP